MKVVEIKIDAKAIVLDSAAISIYVDGKLEREIDEALVADLMSQDHATWKIVNVDHTTLRDTHVEVFDIN